jgi:hypothetical protein
MYAEQTDATTLTRTGALGDRGYAERVVVEEIGGAVRTLHCLSNGYLTGGERCDCHIPHTIVAAA